MASKVCVGGIPWATTDDDLRDAFSKFGSVESATVVKDRETGRSRGFGFVGFTTAEEAQSAVAGMNGKEMDGRTIKVDVANERAPRQNNGGGSY